MSYTFNPFTGNLDITGPVSPYITPEDYGAVGNGSTNDATAIQNALNAAATAKKPVILKANTTYAIAAKLTIPAGVTLASLNKWDKAPTIVNKTVPLEVMIQLTATGGAMCTLQGIRFDGNIVAETIVDVNGSSNALIQDCIFIQATTAIDHTDSAYYNRIWHNSILTTIGITISNEANFLSIRHNIFEYAGGSNSNPIVADTGSFTDTMDISDNVFGGSDTGSSYCIDLRTANSFISKTATIARNRFDCDTFAGHIYLGRYVQAFVSENSCAGQVPHLITCDGTGCDIRNNFLASSTGSGIYLTANSNGCRVYSQNWCTGDDACASEYEDLGTNNVRFDPTRLATDNAKILGLGNDGSLTGNDDLQWSNTYGQLQVNSLSSGSSYLGAASLELSAPSGVGGQLYLTDAGTGTFTLAQQNSTGHFVIQSSNGTGDPAFRIDKDTDLVSVINELEVGGTKSVAAQAYISRDNSDYTNTDGENCHLLVNNPNSTGQTVIASIIDGSLVTKWRTDYVGNISWCAYNPYAGSSWYGAHYFYVNGDYPDGLCKMIMRSNCTDDSISGIGIGYSVVGMQPTAYLHLDAGQDLGNCAPLKFTTGELLSSTEAGAVEYDGTDLYFTNDATTRRKIKTGISANRIDLLVQNAKLPTSNPARIDAGDQNWRLLFDATTSQSAIWQFIMPQDYGTALTARLIFSMNATQTGTNTVKWDVSVAALTPNSDSTDIGAKSFDTVNLVTHTLANNQTAGYPLMTTLTLTNRDSVAAGDIVMIKIDRDIADTASGDAELVGLSIEYTPAI